MDRKKQLIEYVGKDKIDYLEPLIEEVLFMENQLIELKKLPFIKVHPKNKELQKKTEASKLYLSIMAQYTADIKTLSYIAGKSGEEETISPLRLYMQTLTDGGKKNGV